MSRIRRTTPYIIGRSFCNRGLWPLSTSDNTKAFNYGYTVWSTGDAEISGTCLENRSIPFPFPIWSEEEQDGAIVRVDGDYAVNLTLIDRGAGDDHTPSVDSTAITDYSFVARVGNDVAGDNPLYFALRGTISKKIIDFVASGGTFLNSDGTFPLGTLQNINNKYAFDIDSGSWVAPQS